MSTEINPDTDKPYTKAEWAAKVEADTKAREEANAELVVGDLTSAPVVAATVLEAEDEKDAWKRVLIVAGAPARMPNKEDRKVIVVEALDTDGVPVSTNLYPKSADAYLGYLREGDEQSFADLEAPVFLLGGNVRQASFHGLSRSSGYLAVGPAHPVYAAVNLAHQRGATDVKVVGLTQDEITRLRPWFKEIQSEFESLDFGG